MGIPHTHTHTHTCCRRTGARRVRGPWALSLLIAARTGFLIAVLRYTCRPCYTTTATTADAVCLQPVDATSNKREQSTRLLLEDVAFDEASALPDVRVSSLRIRGSVGVSSRLGSGTASCGFTASRRRVEANTRHLSHCIGVWKCTRTRNKKYGSLCFRLDEIRSRNKVHGVFEQLRVL